MYKGDIALSQILYFSFTTRSPNTGAPVTLSGSPSLAIYKDDGTTESTAGITLTADFDSKTGLNLVKIDTSADGTFYATGHDFTVVIAAGTVSSVSVVNETVGYFSINNRSALRPATAGRTINVDTNGAVNLQSNITIKKNTALAAFMFIMTDSTIHNPATGLTVTATRSLDGAAFASCANSVTEVSSGWYKIDLAAGDLNGNVVALRFTASGADDTDITIVTQP